jgi:ABC-type dipeptide/oligopeptide/nickel transport system permease component
MLRYLLKRFLLILPTIFVPLIIVFLLLRLSPGDPAGMLLGDQATPEQIEALRTQLGLNEPYITTARAQGLPERKVIGSYAMRTAAIPVVTVAGLAAGYMLGGAVAIEIIFALPGLGRMLVEAVSRRDYPLVEGGVLTISLILAVLNLVIDVIYAILDPRIRYQ